MDERVEHFLKIESRAADHFEHIGGGGLLLQRFAQFVEQAGILDRDNGLGGKVAQQIDLFVGESKDLLAKNPDFVQSGDYHFWDSLTAATLTDPALVTFQEMRLRVVDAEGPESGRTLPDATGVPGRVAVSADAPGFARIFLATLNGQVP